MIHETMIREILARPQDIAWLPWAVQYFFFIGLACSAVLFAGGAAHLRPSREVVRAAKSMGVHCTDAGGERRRGCPSGAKCGSSSTGPCLAFLCEFHPMVVDVMGLHLLAAV
ncbi:tetrathionate reductase subunit C [Yersinia enterocolitica]|nr:putative tetrathionate reductase subunit C [Yersinia enterocolitica]KGA73992.1 putative tetrathionate reductase subunit C [Yersinia enterocolitica]CNF96803.1 tetrathionate reductase subunit C [Yersinia enterocolitica]CNG72778.1 tetrathionate reductase subunit C [Yersinia enterocolitica]CRX83670.1 tetrathionate reductase subunit C [Yersinia enterocolitica]